MNCDEIRICIAKAREGNTEAAKRLLEFLRDKIIRCEPVCDPNQYDVADYFNEVFSKLLQGKPKDAGKALGLVRSEKGKPPSSEIAIRNLKIAVAVKRSMDQGSTLEDASWGVAQDFGMDAENSDKKVQAIYAKHKGDGTAPAQISFEDDAVDATPN